MNTSGRRAEAIQRLARAQYELDNDGKPETPWADLPAIERIRYTSRGRHLINELAELVPTLDIPRRGANR